MRVYVNYPNSRVSVHTDPSCSYYRMMRKPEQRFVRIDPVTISEELQKFIHKRYTFASRPDSNDMWLEINFRDQEFEWAILQYVHRQLGNYYKPFLGVQIKKHC